MRWSPLMALLGCADPPPTECPGLPDDIPSDWAVVPDGLDTEAFDEQIRAHMREGCLPSLSVSVVDRDGALMTAAWGFVDAVDEVPATTDTPFMIASVSKAFDAIAVLKARELGLLDLDDEVSDLVGFEVANQRTGGGPPIRMRHLVTHTSGIRDNYDVIDASYTVGDSPVPLGAFVEDYLVPGGAHFDRRENFHLWPAGREWMYSNVATALAGYAIEAVSGQPYHAFSRQHVLEPLGLDTAGWFLADFEDPDRIARPHVPGPDGWEVLEHYGYPTYPDGQLRATASELGQLLRFAIGEGEVDGQRILPRDVVRDDLLGNPVDGLHDWYILPHMADQYTFWFAEHLGDRVVIGHDGDDRGVEAEVFFDPETGIGVALVTSIQHWAFEGRVRQHTAAIQQELFELGEDWR